VALRSDEVSPRFVPTSTYNLGGFSDCAEGNTDQLKSFFSIRDYREGGSIPRVGFSIFEH